MDVNVHFDHCNLNVADLKRSLAFYKEALGLEVVGEIHRESYDLVYLSRPGESFRLELTWLHDHPQAYDLGENESHIAFRAAPGEFEKLLAYHKEHGWVCFENAEVGVYFIEDPDGYWLEILPAKKS